jgi:predicted phosphodiesterase
MKIIAIGDIHGKGIWKKIVKQESDADKFVFIGDYFDSFDISYADQQENFKKIIQYKEKHPEKVILLLGNHDYHYLFDEYYSGYQEFNADRIENLLRKGIEKSYFQMCYRHEKFLFTHAGVTKTWSEKYGVINDNVLEGSINLLFGIKPEAFGFQRGENLNSSGDNFYQSPLWVRPVSLKQDQIEGYTQVVGHTHQLELKPSEDTIFVDTFDSCNEYLVIEDGVPTKGIIRN